MLLAGSGGGFALSVPASVFRRASKSGCSGVVTFAPVLAWV
jgi:hypothetical protein